jgi:hypothetical protein
MYEFKYFALFINPFLTKCVGMGLLPRGFHLCPLFCSSYIMKCVNAVDDGNIFYMILENLYAHLSSKFAFCFILYLRAYVTVFVLSILFIDMGAIRSKMSVHDVEPLRFS